MIYFYLALSQSLAQFKLAAVVLHYTISDCNTAYGEIPHCPR